MYKLELFFLRKLCMQKNIIYGYLSFFYISPTILNIIHLNKK